MKTKPSAPAVGRRLRRTLGALLSIGFATTWWKFVPPHESAAEAAPPLITTVPSESPQVRVVVIPIPVVLPFALPTAPTFATPPPPHRVRPHIVHQPQVAIVDPPTHQPFALPPPPEVPPPPVEDPPTIVDDPPIVDDPTTDQPPTDKPPTKHPEPRIRTRSS